jgi:hypothetical protein
MARLNEGFYCYKRQKTIKIMGKSEMPDYQKLIDQLRSWKNHGSVPAGARDVMEKAADALQNLTEPPNEGEYYKSDLKPDTGEWDNLDSN